MSPVQLVHEYYRLLDAHHRLPVEICDPSIRTYFNGSEALGLLETNSLSSGFYSAFPDLEHTILDQVYESGKVASRLLVTGTHKGSFEGLKATQKRFTISAMSMHFIQYGLIHEQWIESDVHGLLGQLKGNDHG